MHKNLKITHKTHFKILFFTFLHIKFTAKEIGDALQVSGRSVSGAIRKLIQDGLVEKVSQDPVTYGLTAAGKEYQFDD